VRVAVVGFVVRSHSRHDFTVRERLATAPAKKEAPRRQLPLDGAQHRPSKREGAGTLAPLVREVTGTAGMPLDSAVSRRMEARFAHDFSRVRVHADAPAAASAEALGARAYTAGEHIVFARNAYSPSTAHGQRLIAHELAHVAQVGHRGLGPAEELRVSAPDSAAEQAARAAAGMAVLGAQVSLPRGSPSGANVFRDPEPNEGAGKLEDETYAYQLIFADLGPQSMDGILKRLDKFDSEELGKLREHSALSQPYGRERLELAMSVVWYSKFARAVLPEMRPSLQAEIDRVVPDATHHDQHEALINFMNQAKAQPSAPSAAAAPAPAPAGKRGASKGATAAPSEETMAKWSEKKQTRWKTWIDTRDAKVQTFGAADYEDYVANMLVSGGSVFGKSIPAANPVHPLFLERLEAASAKARAAIGSDDFGIRNIRGQDNRPGNHAWGIAVDIDADSNPYILNEDGEKVIDAAVAPVYQRIAQAMLGRDSIITLPKAGTGKKDPATPTGLQGASYTALAEESDAMAAYFSVLPDPAPPAAPAPAKGKKAAPAPAPLPAARKMSSVTIDPAKIAALDKAQVQADYELLMGKTRTKGMSGDLPFEGAGSGTWRDPKRGFLSIRKEVAEALKGEGLRWGATDFAGASGDVMHFDDDNRHADYVKYGKSHPTAKKGG
jgi:hypothetical protein